MYSNQIEKDVKLVFENFNKESFIYDLLLAYGISKTSITRLKNGDFNLSKIEGEVLYKKKVLFKEVESQQILTTIDSLTKNDEALKHNPRFVIVTDYQTLLAKDIRTGVTLDTPILELYKHYDFFLPWAGQEKQHHKSDNHADRKASYEMAKLYDILVHENPDIYDDGGHNLNIFLSRILFCFFAEDTDIFPVEGIFTDSLAQHTKNDGSDVHLFLDRLFLRLRTQEDKDIPQFLLVFPYVNGGLFKDSIYSPQFSSKARKILIDCGALDWSEINPDIFGSMIQAVVNPEYRSGLGMHYTSVPNIRKVIDPLFLDSLKEEFEKSIDNTAKLRRLIHRISKLKIFDPACGSGNFLIIAYKELRRLEIKILLRLNEIETQKSIVFTEIKLSQFYGIELDDFAHEMAILSLWLAEHQMNKEFVSDLRDFGKAKPILPLKEAGHITYGNANRLEWSKVCPNRETDETYLLGNPPYLGRSLRGTEQQKDMDIVFSKFTNYKDLDYIACWFVKGVEFIKNSFAQLAFVSTNSICQGTQVNLLWPNLLNYNVHISFCHIPFKWTNNAKSNAGVSVAIIGLSANMNKTVNKIFSNSLVKTVDNITPYLTQGKDTFIENRLTPLSNFPKISLGNAPKDDGALIVSIEEFTDYQKDNPSILPYVRKFIGADEFINSSFRYCLWIEDESKDVATAIPEIQRRLELCVRMREKSKKIPTQKLALTPYKFGEIRHRETSSIIIPSVSSEKREYIPIGFLDENWIISNSAFSIYDAEPWIFGVVTSKMHMVWVRAVAGRLESRIRYSSQLCYNTFPFPKISAKQKENINLHVFAILEERERYPEKTLAQLYDADKMPNGLKVAHVELDLSIERCYRLKPFDNDGERLEYLFKLYEQMTIKI